MKDNHHYTGLTDAQVAESRQKHGANILTPKEKESLFKKFFEKFGDPLIIILLIAGALSLGISFYEFYGLGKAWTVFFEPIGIFVAILLATGVAFIFELNSDKKFAVLNQVNDDEAVKVIRNGNTVIVAKKDVVVGDIVILGTGDEIPADGTLLESVHLVVDESTLTGEPSCYKSTDEAHFCKDATYDTNYVLRGTKVLEGHAVFQVEKVGDATENGKVFQEAQIDDSVKTPLNEQLDGLADLITKLSYIIAGLVVAGRVLVYFFNLETAFVWVDFIAYFLQSLMIAVTLIVVAVPEGLPLAVTLSLAYSMQRMLETNNLVRKLHACDTMGAATVICTDKTGTLTQNQMTVHETQFYALAPSQQLEQDETSRLIAEGIAVNSTATLDLSGNKPKVVGSPTEGASLLWLNSNGFDVLGIKDQMERLEELPFTTVNKYMAIVVRSAVNGKRMLYVNGAPEIVLSLCKQIDGGKGETDVLAQLTAYQQKAMRTLGYAYQVLDEKEDAIKDGKVAASNLTFSGIVAISDPVRADVPAAVQECVKAGIQVKIVTGDTPGTAKEIGRQIGLWNQGDGERNLITGTELAALSDTQLQERAGELKIIARARPTDKQRLVKALQATGEVVAVTGDGTNDAPALNAAHVGLSMGDGTAVAKEASDITIIDNSFSSIGRAVMWGRSLYQNIQRFLLFQLTVNVSACFIVLVGAFLGVESPLTVTQMLWVNLIMDTFGAMALASLPPSEKVMLDKPRDRKAFILNKSMLLNIFGWGGLFFAMLLGLLLIFQHNDITSLADFLHLQWNAHGHVSPYEQTLLFSFFVWTHFWYMFNARAYMTGHSGLRLKGCKGFGIITTVIIVGQLLITEILYNFFNVQPMLRSSSTAIDLLLIIAISSLVLVIPEIIRLLKNKR